MKETNIFIFLIIDIFRHKINIYNTSYVMLYLYMYIYLFLHSNPSLLEENIEYANIRFVDMEYAN